MWHVPVFLGFSRLQVECGAVLCVKFLVAFLLFRHVLPLSNSNAGASGRGMMV